jgi:hypothetical protein
MWSEVKRKGGRGTSNAVATFASLLDPKPHPRSSERFSRKGNNCFDNSKMKRCFWEFRELCDCMEGIIQAYWSKGQSSGPVNCNLIDVFLQIRSDVVACRTFSEDKALGPHWPNLIVGSMVSWRRILGFLQRCRKKKTRVHFVHLMHCAESHCSMSPLSDKASSPQ